MRKSPSLSRARCSAVSIAKIRPVSRWRVCACSVCAQLSTTRDAMTQQGATLQNYNSELVNCIEELREKREELNKSIAQDEEEKGARRAPPLPSFSRRPPPVLTLLCCCTSRCRSQDSERPSYPHRAAGAHQRQPRAQGVVAHRV